ncbi:MAG: DUF2975 domain-containing protein, partial [Tannerellaceae bacterium]|nr:DUF2975 domain-containing protein [Tannerellaceae bacterium]
SLSAVKAVRSIKYCAIISGSLIMLGIIYIRLFVDSDDPAGATALSVAAIFVSTVIAVCAAVCETILQEKLSPASA